MDAHNFEIITCKIGAALNLGYIDDVFKDSEQLIKLSDKKPQVPKESWSIENMRKTIDFFSNAKRVTI